MNENKRLTYWQIFSRGQLTVNLPIILTMSFIFVLFKTIFQDRSNLSLLISLIFGWIYWAYATPKWIKWAFNNNVNQERIYKIGKAGLLIWNRQYLIDVIENNKKPWF